MTTLCKECLQNGYRTYGGTDDEHHHTMPNPTPQQRIEELVREIAGFGEIWTTPFGTVDVCGAMDKGNVSVRAKCDTKPIESFFRQALKQAYLAGLTEVEYRVEKERPVWNPAVVEHDLYKSGQANAYHSILSHISQLKERIK